MTNNNYCYIDRHLYLHFSKSAQSATGLNVLKAAANGRYLINVHIITLCITLCIITIITSFAFTIQKYILSSYQ